MSLWMAVIFSFPLVYQSIHRVEHIVLGQHCCAHHHEPVCAISHSDHDEEDHDFVLTVQNEHCPVCEYEHTAYSLPGDLLKPAPRYYIYGERIDTYRAPFITASCRHYSLRGPPSA